jgi:Mrp family chromosome partitioning ATPase
MNDINFEKDQEEVLERTTNLKSLANQVKILKELEDQVKIDDELLKDKKRDIEKISGEVIPTLLSEMGLSSLKLADGSAVDVKPYYGANISEKNREAAYNWLRSNGLGDIIKNEITVSFGKDEDNKATTYVNLARGQGYQPTQKLKVESMTLKALVRERIEKGVEMPADIFNVFVGNRTKLTRKQ